MFGYFIDGAFLVKDKNKIPKVQNSLGCSLKLPIVFCLGLVPHFCEGEKTQA